MTNTLSLEPQHARDHVSPTYIRTLFSESLSDMYKSEVALYADLVDVVNRVNQKLLEQDPNLREELERKSDLNRLDLERHGAIRLGLPSELRAMARFLRTMDMVSVGYYDLTQAGLPIHATCFRPTNRRSLAENPLRLFVSLLRPEYVSLELRSLVEDILGRRRIFSARTEELVAKSERFGGLTLDEATELVKEGIQTFRWRSATTVSEPVYKALIRPTRIGDGNDGGRADFEAALGGQVLDEMSLYKAIQEESLHKVCTELGIRATSRL